MRRHKCGCTLAKVRFRRGRNLGPPSANLVRPKLGISGQMQDLGRACGNDAGHEIFFVGLALRRRCGGTIKLRFMSLPSSSSAVLYFLKGRATEKIQSG